MKINTLSLLLICTLLISSGCATEKAWMEGSGYVDDAISGRVKLEMPVVSLEGKWEIYAFYSNTWDPSVPEQKKQGTITLKPFGNGWIGVMDWIDLNYDKKRTIREMNVVLSGDKLTMIGIKVIETDWDHAYLDLYTGTWDPQKKEFSGSALGGGKWTMKR